MNMLDIIAKKRDGYKLSKEEIDFFITGYTKGDIPDYQAAALLMAIYIKGLDKAETFELTRAMEYSGDKLNLSDIPGIKVDKHSTGGVGDKTTLIVAPIAVSCGAKLAKMSGRGLGFTGGTIDKMESIPGMKTSLTMDEFKDQVKRIGMAVIGQTADLAPADKKLYALRDVTSTVGNYGLITSSIMSKKLASGADAIILDVKVGDGAFMENMDMARTLGGLMAEVGREAGRKMSVVISGMDQPLGNAVGNAIEVIEAIETLKGNGPADITELATTFAGLMIYHGGIAGTPQAGKEMAEEAIRSGKALAKLAEFIEAQGGNPEVINDYSLFKQPLYKKHLESPVSGFITSIAARSVGEASMLAGAGRATKEDEIDMSAGIYLYRKVGDRVEKGDILATIYSDSEEKLNNAVNKLLNTYGFDTENVDVPPIIRDII